MNRKTKGKQKQKTVSTELLRYPNDSELTTGMNTMKMLGFVIKKVDWTENTLEVVRK